jgi:hypothetical protein
MNSFMKQQKVLFGVGLFLVFGGLIGLIVWNTLDRRSIPEEEVRGIVTTEENATTTKKAVPKATMELCEKVEDLKAKDQCFENLAEVSGDRAVCDRIGDPIEKSFCLTSIAVRNQEVTLCNEAVTPSERDRCVKSVAEATFNVAMCQQISDGNGRDSCIFTIASRRRDPLQCEQIQNTQQQTACEQLLGKKE